MTKSNFDKIRSLIYTEKSNKMLADGKYVFEVSSDTNKDEISSIIFSLYKVKVTSVNIINSKPKTKRFRGFKGVRSGYKKAIVTVEKGKSINFN